MVYYYAVRVGRKCGIFPTWDACKAQVDGFKGAKFKKFNSKEMANDFIGASSSTTTVKRERSPPPLIFENAELELKKIKIIGIIKKCLTKN